MDKCIEAITLCNEGLDKIHDVTQDINRILDKVTMLTLIVGTFWIVYKVTAVLPTSLVANVRGAGEAGEEHRFEEHIEELD